MTTAEQIAVLEAMKDERSRWLAKARVTIAPDKPTIDFAESEYYAITKAIEDARTVGRLQDELYAIRTGGLSRPQA